MARLRWDPGIEFRKLVLEPDFDDRPCAHCGKFTHIYENRDRRLYLLTGATHLVSKIAHCVDKACPGHQEVVQSAAEMSVGDNRLWISDKQKAFVTGIAEVFPGVPHRYCNNHFLRDLAKPVLERDSHAKVQMRRKVRGLRQVERRILDERRKDSTSSTSSTDAVQPTPATPSASGPMAPTAASAPGAARSEAQDIVLEYASGIRGILNDDQGGPLDPPGLRMAEALGEVRASIQRCVERKKGGLAIAR